MPSEATRAKELAGLIERQSLHAWFELREPNCVPERKGPFPQAKIAHHLREFMEARPAAFITVVTVGFDGPSFQDGPECLMMADGRSRARARRHIRTSKAAHAGALR